VARENHPEIIESAWAFVVDSAGLWFILAAAKPAGTMYKVIRQNTLKSQKL